MRSDEFISFLLKNCKTDDDAWRIQNGLPLGVDQGGNAVFARRQEQVQLTKHTCVTGLRKTAFIKRVLLTLSCLYDKTEACFFILSPKTEYGELLRLHNIDATVPYIRTKRDLDDAAKCLEEIDGCNQNGDLEEYRELLYAVSRKKNVEAISGVDLMKSIFSGYPGAYVGVGNCLVTTREESNADVTYVGEDSTLSMPTPMSYPTTPSVMETIILFNALPKDEQ